MEIPSGISEKNWNVARAALSKRFTINILGREEDVARLAKGIDNIEAYDYRFVDWLEFFFADKPEGLFERANNWKGEHASEDIFVVFDPLDDKDGFLFVGVDPLELIGITCRYIIDQEPEEGPLGLDGEAKNAVEDT